MHINSFIQTLHLSEPNQCLEGYAIGLGTMSRFTVYFHTSKFSWGWRMTQCQSNPFYGQLILTLKSVSQVASAVTVFKYSTGAHQFCGIGFQGVY